MCSTRMETLPGARRASGKTNAVQVLRRIPGRPKRAVSHCEDGCQMTGHPVSLEVGWRKCCLPTDEPATRTGGKAGHQTHQGITHRLCLSRSDQQQGTTQSPAMCSGIHRQRIRHRSLSLRSALGTLGMGLRLSRRSSTARQTEWSLSHQHRHRETAAQGQHPS